MTTTIVVRPAGHAIELAFFERGAAVEAQSVAGDVEAHSFHIWAGRTVTISELPAARTAVHPGMETAMSPSLAVPEPLAGGSGPLPVQSAPAPSGPVQPAPVQHSSRHG